MVCGKKNGKKFKKPFKEVFYIQNSSLIPLTRSFVGLFDIMPETLLHQNYKKDFIYIGLENCRHKRRIKILKLHQRNNFYYKYIQSK